LFEFLIVFLLVCGLEGEVLFEGFVEFALGGLIVAVEGEPGVVAGGGAGELGLGVGGGGEGEEGGFVRRRVLIGIGVVAGEGLGVASLGAGVFFDGVVSPGGDLVVEEFGFGGGGSSLLPEEEGDAVGEEVLEGSLGVEFFV
jgi:hypothetical protein